MMTRRFFSLAVVAVSVGSILAGCSADTASSDVTSDDVTNDELSSYDESPITDDDIADPSLADDGETASDVGTDDVNDLDITAQTPAGAIRWYSGKKGSTAYEGYCERAARLSWARKTHHASAIAHWKSSDGTRRTSGGAPTGAFVFWNISKYGHVGISDGKGGAWATGVKGKIGHITSLRYYKNYLGWKAGNSN